LSQDYTRHLFSPPFQSGIGIVKNSAAEKTAAEFLGYQQFHLGTKHPIAVSP